MSHNPKSSAIKNHLLQKIAQLEEKLADARGRMPAHSAKPFLIHEIFDLEDELEELKKELTALQDTSGNEKS